MVVWALKMRPATLLASGKRLSEASVRLWARLGHWRPTDAAVLRRPAVPFRSVCCFCSGCVLKFCNNIQKSLVFLGVFRSAARPS